jgi:hypothetical protein
VTRRKGEPAAESAKSEPMANRSVTELASPSRGSGVSATPPGLRISTQSPEDVRSSPVDGLTYPVTPPLPAAEAAVEASMGCPAVCPRADSGHPVSVQACSCTTVNHVTPVVAVHPDLSRVPQVAIGQTQGKERSCGEECPRPESLCIQINADIYPDSAETPSRRKVTRGMFRC